MSKRKNAIRETISYMVSGLLFFLWIGLAGGYEGQLINFTQFLGSTVLILIIGVCVHQLCWKTI